MHRMTDDSPPAGYKPKSRPLIAFEEAVSNLTATLRHYDEIHSLLLHLVAWWHNLNHDQRVELGQQHPDLVDSLLSIEDRLT